MSHGKKYQIFVSSTYEDLVEERQEVMHALLELNCIPSGMELFPASDDDQWTLIKRVIDDCDYYIVIIGARYGCIGKMGISYTEMEYDYALETGKPIIAFVHKDPSAIANKKSEQTDNGKKLLKEFVLKVQNKTCKKWSDPKDLGSVVSRSLMNLLNTHPAVGWVKADQLLNQDYATEIVRLRNKIDKLEAELQINSTKAPKGTEMLAQGSDMFEVCCSFTCEDENGERYGWDYGIERTWNQIFSEILPALLHEASITTIEHRLSAYIEGQLIEQLEDDAEFKGHAYTNSFKINQSSFETIMIQLNALGLIAQSVKTRSVSDRKQYWTLTEYGKTMTNKLRAIYRDSVV
jgi:hypothetical protein